MTVVSIAVVGIVAVLLAVSLKGMKGEYGTFLVLAAGFFIFFYGVGKLSTILDTMKEIQSYIKINNVYLSTLVKMIGITYIAEFASGICKDAGYGAVGTQIEIFGKLSVLAVSMPILLALIETLQVFLS
jgi:stage III sporulation protein AD